MDWHIAENTDARKYYIQKMGVFFRKYRTDLTKLWREGGMPNFAELQIEEKDWDEFIEYRMTEDFDVCFYAPILSLTKNLIFFQIKTNCFFVKIVAIQPDWDRESETQQVSAFPGIKRV